jgi:nucleotide-binding universal stress UspA family protein
MKTVLLYANEDAGFESRLQAALDVARTFGAHLCCVQVTPFDAFIMGDPFGGVYALPIVVEALREAEDKHRTKIEQRLQLEGVGWDWSRYDGAPAQVVVDRASLVDLIILSLPNGGGGYDGPLAMVGDVALHARAPVLAVPQSSRSFDCQAPALFAWNGSPEAAHALRLTLDMLGKAPQVNIVTVSEAKSDVPPTDAAQYLARRGIACEVHEWPAESRTTAEALTDAARVLSAGYVVMGAYGHSRLSESILGGTTRDMLHRGDIPLLLAH